MAGLSLSELRNRPGRVETLVKKLAGKETFQLVGESSKKFTTVIYSKGGVVYSITPSKNKAEADKLIKYLSTEATSSDKIFISDGKDNFALGKLLKTAEFGGASGMSKAADNTPKGNRGDMAEAILAAGIAARFTHKNTPVTASQVWEIINQLNPSLQQQKKDYDSPNKNPKIHDKVTFQLGLAKANIAAVTNKQVQSTLTDIVNSSVRYANSAIITSWSKLLYENNKYNEIEVIADGIGDQTGTKVDVRVKIDGKLTNVNISLKADDVKQFGQVGGSSFDAQKTLWDTFAKLNVSSYESSYYDKIKDKDVVGALDKVYDGAVEQFNKSFSGNPKLTLSNLSDGITYFATLREKNVTLVQLSREEAQVYKFDNLEKLLENKKLVAFKVPNKKYPEVGIKDETGDVLVSVRIKTENKTNGIYVRNYVEKGKLLTKLASFIAT